MTPSAHPRLFITGATGTLGGEVARQLASSGWPLTAGVRDPARARLPETVQAVPFDFQVPATYGALAGVDRLFLMLPPGTRPRQHVFPVIDAARAHGVQQVVFLSILGAQHLPFLPHRQIERHLEQSGLDWVFLRASYFMQNLTGVHRDDIRLRDELDLPAGQGRTSFVDARDVAAVAALTLQRGHARQAYDLTGDVALNYDEVAAILSVTLGRRIHYADPAPLTFLRTAAARGVTPGFALFMLAEYTVAKLGRAGRTAPDLGRVLGRPATTFRQFAEDHRDHWVR